MKETNAHGCSRTSPASSLRNCCSKTRIWVRLAKTGMEERMKEPYEKGVAILSVANYKIGLSSGGF
jgi:hypothetical protein